MRPRLPLVFHHFLCPKTRADCVELDAKAALRNHGIEGVTSGTASSVNAELCSLTAVYAEKEFTVQMFYSDLDGQIDGVAKRIRVPTECIFIHENHPLAYIEYPKGRVKQLSLNYIISVPEAFPPTDLFQTALTANYTHAESIQPLADKFCQTSAVRLDNFFVPEFLEKCLLDLDPASFVRVGPADYRSFNVRKAASRLCDFFTGTDFKAWLSFFTGFPVAYPARPAILRSIQAAGDYQILHGNYSEPAGIDVIFSWIPSMAMGFEWPEDNLGRIHYLDSEGVELYQVSPASNSLTIVYRTEGATRFTENVRGHSAPTLYQSLITFTIANVE